MYICRSLPRYPFSILVPREFYFNYPTVELLKDASGRRSRFPCPLGDFFMCCVKQKLVLSADGAAAAEAPTLPSEPVCTMRRFTSCRLDS